MMRRKITPGYLYTVPSVQIEDGARWPLCSTPFIYERLHLLFNRTRGGGTLEFRVQGQERVCMSKQPW